MGSGPQYDYVDDASARIKARIELARDAFRRAVEGPEEERDEALKSFELALDEVEDLARKFIGEPGPSEEPSASALLKAE